MRKISVQLLHALWILLIFNDNFLMNWVSNLG